MFFYKIQNLMEFKRRGRFSGISVTKIVLVLV